MNLSTVCVQRIDKKIVTKISQLVLGVLDVKEMWWYLNTYVKTVPEYILGTFSVRSVSRTDLFRCGPFGAFLLVTMEVLDGMHQKSLILMHQSFETPGPHHTGCDPGERGDNHLIFNSLCFAGGWGECSLSLLHPTGWGMRGNSPMICQQSHFPTNLHN